MARPLSPRHAPLLLSLLLVAGACSDQRQEADDFCRGRFAVATTIADSSAVAGMSYGALRARSCSAYLGQELRARKAVTP